MNSEFDLARQRKEDDRAVEWGRAAMVISEVSGIFCWFGEAEQQHAINKALDNAWAAKDRDLEAKVWAAIDVLDKWEKP